MTESCGEISGPVELSHGRAGPALSPSARVRAAAATARDVLASLVRCDRLCGPPPTAGDVPLLILTFRGCTEAY